MNVQWFRVWKEGIEQLNKMSSDIQRCREEAEELLSERIKQIFERNDCTVESIEFSTDSSAILVRIKEDTANSIHFNKKFMFEIGMAFSVERTWDIATDHELMVRLYPLEDV